MSIAESGHIEFPPDPIAEAVALLDSAQAVFIDRSARWARFPTNHRLEEFNSAAVDCVAFYAGTMRAIIEAPEDAYEVKASQMATVYLGTDAKRVDCLRKIAPKGEFFNTPEPHNEVTSMYLDLLAAGIDSDQLVEIARCIFLSGISTDSGQLAKSVSSRQQLLDVAHKASEHLGDIGKTAAGVVAGGLVLSQLTKRNSRKF